jgi:hypothetical protein
MSQRSVERQLASVGSQRSSLVAIGESSAITNPERRFRSLTTFGKSPLLKAFFATRRPGYLVHPPGSREVMRP